MNVVSQFYKRKPAENPISIVSFDRTELRSILKIYGQMVSSGQWRDYSISYSNTNAIFSIFKRTSEKPLYVILKNPKLSKQGRLYSIVGLDGRIINQGANLRKVLQIFYKQLFKII